MKSIQVELNAAERSIAGLSQAPAVRAIMPVEEKGRFRPEGSITVGVITLSRWSLSPEERDRVARGEDIYLAVLASWDDADHPPVGLSVGLND